MTTKAFRFKKALLEDLAYLFLLRNDPETRKNSLSSEEITMKQHREWFRTTKEHIYICYLTGEPIGVVRFSDKEMSWTITPEFRGKGYGKVMVKEARKLHPRVTDCRVKKANIASLKIAHEAGLNVTLVA